MQNEKVPAAMQDNVTQADVAAAKAYLRNVFEAPLGKEYSLDEAFAAHRIASTTAQTEAVQKLVEALEKIAEDRFGVGFSEGGKISLERRDIARAALAAHRESQP